MKALLVKLTSLGDLIHALPALTDAQRAIPDIRFDWVIDENFYEVAHWHPSVDNTFTTAHRRWRKQKWQTFRSGELVRTIKAIRAQEYDVVIDGQTNMKAAVVTRLTRGLRCGLDKSTARERLAHLAYQRQYHVDKSLHAVERLRRLFALSLSYPIPTTPPDFAIDRQKLQQPDLLLPKQYYFFVHNASWQTKLWPEAYWAELIKKSVQSGKKVLLPSGNTEEYARAVRLAAPYVLEEVIALPHLTLSEIGYIIAHADAAVCNDTGLSHLTGALGIPSVNLYGPTDSGLIGAPGDRQIHLQAPFGCAPCYKQACFYKGASEQKPACFTQLPPEKVWQALEALKKNIFL